MKEYFVYIITNPILWVSLIAPIIIRNNYLEVRNYLYPAIHEEEEETGEEGTEEDEGAEEEEEGNRQDAKRHSLTKKEIKLKKTIDSDWSYAWNDFNNQLFVVTVSTIFLGVESFAILYRLYNSFDSKGINFLDFFWVNYGIFIGLILVVVFLIGLIWWSVKIFFKGISAEPDIIELYIPEPTDKKRKAQAPPPKSPLTKLRYYTIIYAIYLMIWSISFLPNIYKAIKQFKPLIENNG